MENTYLERFLNAMDDLKKPDEDGFKWDEQIRNTALLFAYMFRQFRIEDNDWNRRRMTKHGSVNRDVTQNLFYSKLQNIHRKIKQLDDIVFKHSCNKKLEECPMCQFKNGVQFSCEKASNSEVKPYIEKLFDKTKREQDQKFMKWLNHVSLWQQCLMLASRQFPQFHQNPIPIKTVKVMLSKCTNWIEFIFGPKNNNQ
jgi:hypothetical protein